MNRLAISGLGAVVAVLVGGSGCAQRTYMYSVQTPQYQTGVRLACHQVPGDGWVDPKTELPESAGKLAISWTAPGGRVLGRGELVARGARQYWTRDEEGHVEPGFEVRARGERLWLVRESDGAPFAAADLAQPRLFPAGEPLPSWVNDPAADMLDLGEPVKLYASTPLLGKFR